MKKYLIVFFFILSIGNCFGEESKVALEKVHVDLQDMASIKRGAKFFANVCMACHTVMYLRYDPIAKEAGISRDKTPVGVKYFGIAPPDLSLITRARSPDWVYTYLHSFYIDSARPTGYNNLVLPNTAMPNFLASFQGQQVLAEGKARYLFTRTPQWYDLIVLQQQGSMTVEQFDATITDVVNFLAYAAEPYRVQQVRIGWYVLIFLIVFFVFTWLQYKEYWKDIKKRHK